MTVLRPSTGTGRGVAAGLGRDSHRFSPLSPQAQITQALDQTTHLANPAQSQTGASGGSLSTSSFPGPASAGTSLALASSPVFDIFGNKRMIENALSAPPVLRPPSILKKDDDHVSVVSGSTTTSRSRMRVTFSDDGHEEIPVPKGAESDHYFGDHYGTSSSSSSVGAFGGGLGGGVGTVGAYE